MSEEKSYQGIQVSYKPYDYRDKVRQIRWKINTMLARMQDMFEWQGLPDTIPQDRLELMLQCYGSVVVTKAPEGLYAFRAELGGTPDAYYMPTVAVVANPGLNFYRTLKINQDCVVIPNDVMYQGLMELHRYYATSLVENELTLEMADIGARDMALLTAQGAGAAKAASKYVDDLERGKRTSVGYGIAESINVNPTAGTASAQAITGLLEYHQYLRAAWYQDLGIQADHNGKREAINSAEAGLNEDTLIPLPGHMLQCRQRAAEAINAMYGTNISVELSSLWLRNQELVEEDPQKREEVEPDERDVENSD